MGPMCSRCLEWRRAEPCGACGVTRPLRRRAPDGSALCGSCVERRLTAEVQAAKRRAVIDVVARIEPGLSAEVIAAAVDEACDITWRLTKVATAVAADPGCLVSGRSSAPVQVDRLSAALRDRGACRIAEFVCERCGRPGRCQAVTGGEAICGDCVPRRLAACAGCGRISPVAAIWAGGEVCVECYHRTLASKGICECCGRRRRIDPRDASGQRRCSDCAGLPALGVCEGCGGEDRIWRNRRCYACNLSDQLLKILGGPDGHIPAWMTGLYDTLTSTGSPKQVLRWLARPEVAATLAGMANGDLAANHDTLDALGTGGWVDHLRQVLVTAGVLPGDEPSAKLERWIEARLESVTNSSDRRLIDAFATWWVLRRYRHRAPKRQVPSVDYSHSVINTAIALLEWNRAHGKDLSTLSQADIDMWIVSGPPSRRHARDFLRWAHQRRLCGQLDISRPASPLPVASGNIDELTAIAKRLLADDTIALVDRVAGLLVICYGQLLSRIVELTTDRITTRDGTTTLRLGNTDIDLPQPIENLLRQLAANRTGYTIIDSPEADWLFPGGQPGRPITLKQLQKRLGRLGIRARAARSTMLLDYAATVPPAVIADMLGIHPGTAIRWAHAAAADWNGYAALRSRTG